MRSPAITDNDYLENKTPNKLFLNSYGILCLYIWLYYEKQYFVLKYFVTKSGIIIKRPLGTVLQ